jgi:hypothetical protein
MDVEIDDGDSSTPCASSAWAAPTATLLNRQNPIARLRSA